MTESTAGAMRATLMMIVANAGAEPPDAMVSFDDGSSLDGKLRHRTEIGADVWSLARPLLKPNADQRLPPVPVDGKMIDVFFTSDQVRRCAVVRESTDAERPSGLVVAKAPIDFPGRR